MHFRAGVQGVRKVCVRGWMQAAVMWSRGLDLVCTTSSGKVARLVKMEIQLFVTLPTSVVKSNSNYIAC